LPSDAVIARIGEIRSQLMALSATPTAAPSASSATAVSGTTFAQALDSALTAQQGWTAPVQGAVTSEFGPRWGTMHRGLDIAAGTGTPVQAAGAGTVRSAGWQNGYGNTVVIDHGDGTSTLYAHNSSLAVQAGQRVEAGTVISKVGSTGDSTGPHLHFEVQVNGEKIDPRPWLVQRGITL
jgi:murein DD-endopeptidase MepM/ murein hydrolase activator NlpD